MIDPLAALPAVLDALNGADVEYVLVGSVAATAWGLVRATRNVDMVALIDPASLERVLALLHGPDFSTPVDSARAAVRSHGSFNILDTVGSGKFDVFVGDPSDAFLRSTLDRRQLAEFPGFGASVASAEDIVLSKLRWRLESRSEQQWRDCVEIVAANAQLDRRYLSAWAEHLGVSDDLADLLDDT